MAQANISQHPMVLHKLTILRDKSTEPRKFRELVKEISALLTYEATRDLPTIKKTVDTPMGKA
ncbi:MAG: uracil phosphoribosyltransferase, partial [Anaerolineales bacterium]|nr:uracil phosphoribosyltransferase [Anaerolineales bacterium]